MQAFDYEAAFAPMHLVFLKQDTYQCHLDFKLLDENNNVIISRKFYLKLLKTMSICDNQIIKIYVSQSIAVLEESQAYLLKKLTDIDAYFFYETEV